MYIILHDIVYNVYQINHSRKHLLAYHLLFSPFLLLRWKVRMLIWYVILISIYSLININVDVNVSSFRTLPDSMCSCGRPAITWLHEGVPASSGGHRKIPKTSTESQQREMQISQWRYTLSNIAPCISTCNCLGVFYAGWSHLKMWYHDKNVSWITKLGFTVKPAVTATSIQWPLALSGQFQSRSFIFSSLF